jgi:hypothetical protein
MRYLGGSKDKDLTTAEVAEAHASGLDIGLNYEGDTSDADGGFAGGVRSATIANDQADALGAPTDGSVWIYYSVDTARTADQVRPYYQGIASVGRRPAAGYGGTEIRQMKREGLCRAWWQANAGSWSGFNTSDFPTDPEADMRQYVAVANPIPGASIDQNDQMAPDCGLWLAPNSTNPGHDDLSPAEIAAIESHLDLTVRSAEATINKAQDDHATDVLNAIKAIAAEVAAIRATTGA